MSLVTSLTATPPAVGAIDPAILSNAHRADLSKAEYFDVLTPEGRPTGRTKLRSEVHRDGDWHASVHIWLLHSRDGRILLQKRAACKDSFPGCWDVSCAGHLAAGETAESAAVAELAEELGIIKPPEVPFERFFQPMSTLARSTVSQGGKFIDNEVTFVYWLEGDWSAEEMTLQAEEVEAVKWVQLEDLLDNLAKTVGTHENDRRIGVPAAATAAQVVAVEPFLSRSLCFCLAHRIPSSSASPTSSPTRRQSLTRC